MNELKCLAHLGPFCRDLAWRVSAVLGLCLIGALIEERGKSNDVPERKGMLLNVAQVFVFYAADLSIGAMTASSLYLLVHKILPGYQAPIRFGGGPFGFSILTSFALATQDFSYYWMHRLQHASKWLWAEHELHHSDEHVNVTTNWRHHWLETVLVPLTVLPVLLLFNSSAGMAVWVILFVKIVGYFLHFNLPIRFGWFNRVIATPQTHRIHHSLRREHWDKNFAAVVPVWDILFGTYYHPKEDEWPETGVAGVRVTSLWQAFVMPFVSWGTMLRAAVARRSVRDPVDANRA